MTFPPPGADQPRPNPPPRAERPSSPASPRRPSKLDRTGQEKVCAVLAVGGTLEMAARVAGCTARAIRYAAARDSKFCQRLLASKERTAVESLTTMSEARKDPKQWRCAYYHARMVYPERYHRAPGTLPVKQARKLIDQAVDSAVAKTLQVVESVVSDPATRSKIGDGLKQAFRRARRPR